MSKEQGPVNVQSPERNLADWIARRVHGLDIKPIHKAICAGVGGAIIAFAIASFACADGRSFRSEDGMVFIVCCPQVEDDRPWYWALAAYFLAFTPTLLFTSPRIHPETFRHDHAA